jgi:hypothetical protein
MKQLFLSMLIVASFVFGLTGCAPDTIAKAKKESSKLASYADKGVNVTRDLYQQKLISLELKDKIADGFIKLGDAGIAFDADVANAEKVYGSSVPAPEIEKLFATFDTNVVGQFLAVLASFKLINSSAAIAAVIESIKAAVLVIADAFGKRVVVAAEVN